MFWTLVIWIGEVHLYFILFKSESCLAIWRFRPCFETWVRSQLSSFRPVFWFPFPFSILPQAYCPLLLSISFWLYLHDLTSTVFLDDQDAALPFLTGRLFSLSIPVDDHHLKFRFLPRRKKKNPISNWIKNLWDESLKTGSEGTGSKIREPVQRITRTVRRIPEKIELLRLNL